MPARSSSPILAVLTELGPLDERGIGRPRAHLERVPDPRSRRGRWYPLVSVVLICSCAVVSGARTIEEIAEWGQRRRRPAGTDGGAPPPARPLPCPLSPHPHPDPGRRRRRRPGHGRGRLPGRTRPRRRAGRGRGRAIAVDGKAPAGSAHLVQRHRHLLSALSHAPATITLAQRVGLSTSRSVPVRSLARVEAASRSSGTAQATTSSVMRLSGPDTETAIRDEAPLGAEVHRRRAARRAGVGKVLDLPGRAVLRDPLHGTLCRLCDPVVGDPRRVRDVREAGHDHVADGLLAARHGGGLSKPGDALGLSMN